MVHEPIAGFLSLYPDLKSGKTIIAVTQKQGCE